MKSGSGARCLSLSPVHTAGLRVFRVGSGLCIDTRTPGNPAGTQAPPRACLSRARLLTFALRA